MKRARGKGPITAGGRDRPAERERGFALVTALVVIALMMAAGALLAASLQYRMWLVRQEVEGIHLTALADAGLALALDRFSLSHFWDGVGAQPLGDGSFSVAVEMGDQAMTRVVTVTASRGPAVRSVRAVVLLSDHFPPRVISWQPVVHDPVGGSGRGPSRPKEVGLHPGIRAR